MSYGNRSNAKVLLFNFKNLKREDDEAIIEVYDPSKGETIDHASYVEGQLYDIAFGEAEYKDDKFPTVKIKLADGDERYVVSFGFKGSITGLARNVLNKLLSCQSFDKIKISYFGKKDDWKNVSVTADGEKLEYFLSLEETNSLRKQYKDDNGKVIKTDYEPLNEVLRSKIKEMIIPYLPKIEEPEADAISDEDVKEVQEKQEHADQSQNAPEVETSDDVPF